MTEMERSGIEVISCLRSNPGGKPGMLAFGDFCSGVFLYDNCGRIINILIRMIIRMGDNMVVQTF